MDRLVPTSTASDVICDSKHKIPSYAQLSSYHKDYYIQRTLRKQTLSLNLLIEDFKRTLIIVKDATKWQVESLGVRQDKIGVWEGGRVDAGVEWNVIIACREKQLKDEELFREVCLAFSGTKAVHLLQLSGDILVPLKSCGPVAEIMKFVNVEPRVDYLDQISFAKEEMRADRVEPLEEMTARNNVVVIADDAGAGKSFALAQMASQIKKNHPKSWVAWIDLSKYAITYCQSFSLKDIKLEPGEYGKSVDYLYKMVKRGNSKLEYNILKHMCRMQSKVVALFDGFDETCPSYNEIALTFLRFLKRQKGIKIWVTTRLYEKKVLEENMESLAYTLSPLTKIEQIEFLDKFWKKCLESLLIDREKFKKKIEEISKTIGQKSVDEAVCCKYTDFFKRLSFSDEAQKLLDKIKLSLKDFSEVPLNVFMLGVVWFDNGFSIDKDLKMGQLYEMFTDIILNIFIQQKCGTSGNVSANLLAEMFKNEMYQAYKNLSSRIYYTSRKIVFPVEIDRSIRSIHTQIRERVGLVRESQFLHKTWEEYFFSIWLMDNLNKNGVSQFLFETILANEKFSLVRQFLDFHFERRKYEIELNENAAEVVKFLEIKPKMGTSLHLLADEGLSCIMDLLFTKFHERALNIILEKSFNHRNVLHLACHRDHDEAITTILNFVHDFGSPDDLHKLMLQSDMSNTMPFHYISSRNSISLVVDFLKRKKLGKDTMRQILMDKSPKNLWYSSLLGGDEGTIQQMMDLANQFLTNVEFCHMLSKKQSCVIQFCHLFQHVNSTSLKIIWDCISQKLSREFQLQLLITVTNDGESLLRYSSWNEDKEVLHWLWKLSKEVVYDKEHVKYMLFKCDRKRDTVLHVVRRGHLFDFLELLLESSELEEDEIAKMFMVKNEKGQTAPMAVLSSNNSRDIFKIMCRFIDSHLKKHAVEILMMEDGQRNNILHLNYHCYIQQGTYELANEDVIMELLVKYATEDQIKSFLCNINNQGDSILHTTANINMKEILDKFMDIAEKHLLDEFVDFILKRNKENKTFFHIAFRKWEESKISALASKFNTLNINKLSELLLLYDNEEMTIFHLSLRRGNNKIVESLWRMFYSRIQKKKLIKLLLCPSLRRDMAFHMALKNKNETLFESFENCCSKKIKKQMREILTQPGKGGFTMFQIAIGRRNAAFIRYLWNIYTEIDFEKNEEFENQECFRKFLLQKNDDGLTAFHIGVLRGDIGIVSDVINYLLTVLDEKIMGELILMPYKGGFTSLHIAVIKENINLFRYLWQTYTSILSKEKLRELILSRSDDKDAILHIGVLIGNIVIIEELFHIISHGSCEGRELILMQGNNGRTCLQIALAKENMTIIRYFWENIAKILSKNELRELILLLNDKKETILHIGIETGNAAILNEVFEISSNELGPRMMKDLIIMKNSDGLTIFHIALAKEDISLIQNLWKKCCKILEPKELQEFLLLRNTFGDNALHIGLKNGSIEILNFMFNIFCSVLDIKGWENSILMLGRDGFSSLQVAAVRENITIMKYFWENIAKILSKNELRELILLLNDKKDTILHTGIKTGNAAILNEVFEISSNELSPRMMKDLIIMKNIAGLTIFHIALAKEDISLIQNLWKKCCKILEPKELQEFLLLRNALDENIFHVGVRNGNIEILNFMFKIFNRESLKKSILIPGRGGLSSLQEATGRENMILIRYLWENYAKILSKKELSDLILWQNKHRNTILHFCIAMGDIALVREVFKICSNELDPEMMKDFILLPNEDGWAIPHFAVAKEDLSLFRCVLDKCNEILGKQGLTKFLLLKDNNQNNAFSVCVQTGNIAILQDLFNIIDHAFHETEREEFVKTEGIYGFSSLQAAVNTKNMNLVRYLWKNYTRILSREKLRELILCLNDNKDTVLHTVVKTGDYSITCEVFNIVSSVLDDGKMMKDLILKTDINGWTIFHIAAAKHYSLIRYLWEKCKEFLTPEELREFIPMQNGDKHTILQIGIIMGDIEVVHEVFKIYTDLLDSRMMRNIILLENKDGWTIFHMVAGIGNKIPIRNLWNKFNDIFIGEEGELRNILLRKNKAGDTPFHIGVKTRNVVVIQELCDIISNVRYAGITAELLSMQDKNGLTPVQLAKGDSYLTSYLEKKYKEVSNSE